MKFTEGFPALNLYLRKGKNSLQRLFFCMDGVVFMLAARYLYPYYLNSIRYGVCNIDFFESFKGFRCGRMQYCFMMSIQFAV